MSRTKMPNDVAVIRGKRVREIREKLLGISRPKFEEKYGIPKNTLRNWEQGTASGLTDDGVRQLCKAFEKAGVRVSQEWLMDGIGQSPVRTTPNQDTRLIGDLLGRPTSTACIKELLISFHQKYPNATDALVENNDLSPYLNADEHALGLRYYGDELGKALNALCIVHTTDKKAYLGYLRFVKNKGYQLQTQLSDDSKHDLTIDIFSAAPVVAVLRKTK